MKFRAILHAIQPQERITQTFHPTLAQAEAWACEILNGKSRDPQDRVWIHEERWVAVTCITCITCITPTTCASASMPQAPEVPQSPR